jgi:hypothetical protein
MRTRCYEIASTRRDFMAGRSNRRFLALFDVIQFHLWGIFLALTQGVDWPHERIRATEKAQGRRAWERPTEGIPGLLCGFDGCTPGLFRIQGQSGEDILHRPGELRQSAQGSRSLPACPSDHPSRPGSRIIPVFAIHSDALAFFLFIVLLIVLTVALTRR